MGSNEPKRIDARNPLSGMALYTTELAAEAMREKARAETERAKQMAAIQHERERAQFHEASALGAAGHSIDPGVLSALSRRELYEHARQRGVQGRSKMTKQQLIEAVRHSW
jgi:hypothetical protein